jgi:ketosteroid isomerase-like protein
MKRFILCVALGLGMQALATAPASDADRGSPTDILQVRNVEITFHQAGSVLPSKDLGLMMSLYADDAVLTDTANGNKQYKGKDQVRHYFLDVAGPFRPQNHWIGYTPAMRIRSQVDGDKATLYFQCLWVDVDKNAIGAHSFSDMTLARVNGRWLVKTISVGKVDKL